MKFLCVRGMRPGYDGLQEALSKEGEVILTRHGIPFARVLPYDGTEKKMPSLKAFRAQQKVKKFPSSIGIRMERDER
jgi:antitoxin (DNA-binding transcriptional repressor) of toxin-antitoxin stability system